jgi:hypothetical protein
VTDVHVLGDAIARALGGGWVAAPGRRAHHRDATLTGGDGEVLALELTNSSTPRLMIRGEFSMEEHRTRPLSARRHEITVAPHRTPARIAAEITRRLLPDYRVEKATASRQAAHVQQEEPARIDLVNSLAITHGADVARVLPGGDEFRVGHHDCGAQVRVPSLHWVQFTIRVPAELARKLNSFLAEHFPGYPADGAG